jgi:hypothetical protein
MRNQKWPTIAGQERIFFNLRRYLPYRRPPPEGYCATGEKRGATVDVPALQSNSSLRLSIRRQTALRSTIPFSINQFTDSHTASIDR